MNDMARRFRGDEARELPGDDDGIRLSRDELGSVVRRAVARDTKREGEFTRAELIAAGREIGVEAASLEAAYDAHVRGRAREEQEARENPRPFDTRIVIESDSEHFLLRVP